MIIIFQLKIVIFAALKNRCFILHRRVNALTNITVSSGDAVEIGLKALRILTGGAKRLPIMNGYARFFEKPGDIGTLRRDLSILPNEPRHVFRDLQGRVC